MSFVDLTAYRNAEKRKRRKVEMHRFIFQHVIMFRHACVILCCVKSGQFCDASRYGFALKHKHLAEMAKWTGLNEDTPHVEPSNLHMSKNHFKKHIMLYKLYHFVLPSIVMYNVL